MNARTFTLGIAALVALAGPLAAQGKGKHANDRDDKVPPGQRPPAGMCRIWIDGVPPGQQPAPTDCATAQRNVPSNGRVLYGGGVGQGQSRGKSQRRDRDDRYDDRRDRRDDRRDDRRGDRRDDRRDRRDDRRDGDRDHDRDHDRRDDDRRDRDRRDRDSSWGTGRPNTCIDANRDGRCDSTSTIPTSTGGSYPRTLPEMVGTVLIDRGSVPSDAARWLGTQPVRGTYLDADKNRVPERIVWRNSRNQIVQVWSDTNRDGRADVVQLFRDGRMVATRR